MTISIRRTSRAADSPGRYFDRVSLDPYYMHRHRTGRSTSTWVPAGPLLQHFHRSIRSVGLEPNADRFGSHPFRWAHIPAVMTPAHTTQFGSNHIRFASTSTRTAPVDDQLPPRRSHNVDSSYFQYFGNFFRKFFFCYHIGITFRSRSLVVFFQLRSVSCAPFTPTFADGVVQRSLALYLPCFVSLSPWMAESHLTPIIIPYSPRTNHPLSATAIVAHDFPSWFFSRSMTPFV